MRFLFLVAFLGASACFAQCKCITENRVCVVLDAEKSDAGISYEVAGANKWTCKEIEKAEKRIVDALVKIPTFSLSFIPAGFTLHLTPYSWWDDDVALPDGGVRIRNIAGLTKCVSKEMWIDNEPTWQASSMAHEYAHMLQNCDSFDYKCTPRDLKEGNDEHCGWDKLGVWKVIENFAVETK